MPDSPSFQYLKKNSRMKRDKYVLYTLHVHTASDGLGYTLHVHTAGGGKRYTLHFILLVVERGAPCTLYF
jgi:hypothetical protein